MNNPTPLRTRAALRAGVTLLELSVIILALMVLIAVLVMGAQAWKRGSDRAGCITLIRQVQVAVRSFSNMNGYNPGDNVAPRNLSAEIIGVGGFVEAAPECPGAGSYSYGANVIPEIGSLYMTCSLNGAGHEPADFDGW